MNKWTKIQEDIKVITVDPEGTSVPDSLEIHTRLVNTLYKACNQETHVITKVVRIHYLLTINVCTKSSDNLFNICWDSLDRGGRLTKQPTNTAIPGALFVRLDGKLCFWYLQGSNHICCCTFYTLYKRGYLECEEADQLGLMVSTLQKNRISMK